jgi:hypothetical protein
VKTAKDNEANNQLKLGLHEVVWNDLSRCAAAGGTLASHLLVKDLTVPSSKQGKKS